MTSPQPDLSRMSSSDSEFLPNPLKQSRNLRVLFRIGCTFVLPHEMTSKSISRN